MRRVVQRYFARQFIKTISRHTDTPCFNIISYVYTHNGFQESSLISSVLKKSICKVHKLQSIHPGLIIKLQSPQHHEVLISTKLEKVVVHEHKNTLANTIGCWNIWYRRRLLLKMLNVEINCWHVSNDCTSRTVQHVLCSTSSEFIVWIAYIL